MGATLFDFAFFSANPLLSSSTSDIVGPEKTFSRHSLWGCLWVLSFSMVVGTCRRGLRNLFASMGADNNKQEHDAERADAQRHMQLPNVFKKLDGQRLGVSAESLACDYSI